MQGSPSQGIINNEVLVAEENEIQNIPLQTLEQTGGPGTSIQNVDESLDDQTQEGINAIPPEATTSSAGPKDNIPESLPEINNLLLESEPPQEEPLILARPAEAESFIEPASLEQASLEIPQISPEEGFLEGVLSKFSMKLRKQYLLKILLGEEEQSSGRPIQEESLVSTPIELAEAEINTLLQISPENSSTNGNPQEGITTVAIMNLRIHKYHLKVQQHYRITSRRRSPFKWARC